MKSKKNVRKLLRNKLSKKRFLKMTYMSSKNLKEINFINKSQQTNSSRKKYLPINIILPTIIPKMKLINKFSTYNFHDNILKNKFQNISENQFQGFFVIIIFHY